MQSQVPASVAAAFDNRLGTLLGQHGVPFIGKKRSGEEERATSDQPAVVAPPTGTLAASASTATTADQSHQQQAAPSPIADREVVFDYLRKKSSVSVMLSWVHVVDVMGSLARSRTIRFLALTTERWNLTAKS